MTEPRGMLTQEELAAGVDDDIIQTVLAVFPDLYGRLIGKRFEARFFVENTAERGTHACDYLLTVDMEMEPVAGYRFANWESGYGDFHLVPDFTSLRVASWLEKTAMVLCDLVDATDHQPVACAPRSLLRKQVEQAASTGFDVMADVPRKPVSLTAGPISLVPMLPLSLICSPSATSRNCPTSKFVTVISPTCSLN